MKSEIEATVAENKVVVYSKSYCPYSRKTKKKLDEAKIDYKAIELDKMENGEAVSDALHELTGLSTVPNVFVNGQHIGGSEEFDELGMDMIKKMIGQN